MDDSTNAQSLAASINKNWYSITIIGIVLIGVIMLFYQDLSSKWQEVIVPAMVVYTLGTSVIGYIQGAYFRAHGNKTGEPIRLLFVYYALHSLWFLAFLWYLTFYKQVL